MQNRTRAVLLSCFVFALACSGGPDGKREHRGRSGEKGEDGPPPDTRTLVEVAGVESGAVSDFLVASSTVESEAEADLFPETSGRVLKILAEEGDAVTVGQVLAIIENASLDAGLDRALAEFARAKASASEMKVLQAVGAVSERELADAEYTLANARATRDEAQKSQGFTRIVSPIDGTLSIREVRYGEIAGAGSRAFQVVDLARLRVIVQLPERDLSRVREGLSVVLIPTYDPSVQVPARVVRVAPVVDPTSGTFRVTIALEATQATIRPGQFVSVRIEVGRHDDTLIVPRVAVLYDEGEPYVFVLAEPDPEEEDEEEVDSDKEDDGPGFFARLFGGDEDSDKDDDKDDDEDEGNTPERIVKRVDIETGFVELQRAEVSSGLELGDQVVTVGHETLRDGASVRLVGDEKEGEDGDAAESNSEQESDAEAEG